jgi:DNA-binding NarL/FixJ family response regulator
VEVVGVATQPTELLLAAGLLRADVLLVPMVDDGLPGIASHVLDQYPHIKIVAISNDGRQVLLCALRPQVFRIITPSLEELIATIRSVARQAAD